MSGEADTAPRRRFAEVEFFSTQDYLDAYFGSIDLIKSLSLMSESSDEIEQIKDFIVDHSIYLFLSSRDAQELEEKFESRTLTEEDDVYKRLDASLEAAGLKREAISLPKFSEKYGLPYEQVYRLLRRLRPPATIAVRIGAKGMWRIWRDKEEDFLEWMTGAGG